MDILKFEVQLPAEPVGADIAGGLLTLRVNGELLPPIKTEKGQESVKDLEGPQGAAVVVSFCYVDDATIPNKSAPTTFEAVLADTFAPPQPGAMGIVVTGETDSEPVAPAETETADAETETAEAVEAETETATPETLVAPASPEVAADDTDDTDDTDDINVSDVTPAEGEIETTGEVETTDAPAEEDTDAPAEEDTDAPAAEVETTETPEEDTDAPAAEVETTEAEDTDAPAEESDES